MRSSDSTVDNAVVYGFQLLGIGIFNLFLDPGRVVLIHGLLLPGPKIGNEVAGAARGDAEDVKCIKRGIILLGQIKGDLGCIITRGRCRGGK